MLEPNPSTLWRATSPFLVNGDDKYPLQIKLKIPKNYRIFNTKFYNSMH